MQLINQNNRPTNSRHRLLIDLLIGFWFDVEIKLLKRVLQRIYYNYFLINCKWTFFDQIKYQFFVLARRYRLPFFKQEILTSTASFKVKSYLPRRCVSIFLLLLYCWLSHYWALHQRRSIFKTLAVKIFKNFKNLYLQK